MGIEESPLSRRTSIDYIRRQHLSYDGSPKGTNETSHICKINNVKYSARLAKIKATYAQWMNNDIDASEAGRCGGCPEDNASNPR